ncbi:hypothetical protein T265_15896, partial [Opisthorchis viverrini]
CSVELFGLLPHSPCYSFSLYFCFTGGLIVPAGAFGILVGGLILNRFRFRRRGAIRFVTVVNLVIMAGIASFFFLGCANPPVAGITVDYPSHRYGLY